MKHRATRTIFSPEPKKYDIKQYVKAKPKNKVQIRLQRNLKLKPRINIRLDNYFDNEEEMKNGKMCDIKNRVTSLSPISSRKNPQILNMMRNYTYKSPQNRRVMLISPKSKFSNKMLAYRRIMGKDKDFM